MSTGSSASPMCRRPSLACRRGAASSARRRRAWRSFAAPAGCRGRSAHPAALVAEAVGCWWLCFGSPLPAFSSWPPSVRARRADRRPARLREALARSGRRSAPTSVPRTAIRSTARAEASAACPAPAVRWRTTLGRRASAKGVATERPWRPRAAPRGEARTRRCEQLPCAASRRASGQGEARTRKPFRLWCSVHSELEHDARGDVATLEALEDAIDR